MREVNHDANCNLQSAIRDLQIATCYQCHKCTAGCPVAFAMEYGPDHILRHLQMGHWERVLTSRDIWLCLGCEMCAEHCPNGIDIGEVMIELRKIATKHGYRREDCDELREMLAESVTSVGQVSVSKATPAAGANEEPVIDDRLCIGIQRLNQLSQTIAKDHNVSGDDNTDRLIWSQNLEHIPTGLANKQKAAVVYFVGCVGAFFPRSYRVPQMLTRILQKAEVDFTTLGGEEWCCGYPLLALGEMEKVEKIVRHNVAQMEKLGASKLVSTCPSCYHMWKAIYPKVLGEELEFEVYHATELLADLIDQSALPLNTLPLKVTYHDPCDLGRKSEVYEAPRKVLQSIPDLTLREMSGSRSISECCGGGGNLESFDPEAVSDVALHRIDRACEVEAQVIVSACQQCERTLMAATRRHKEARRARMRVMDITELIWQAMNIGS